MKAAALALLFASGSLAARGTAGRRARHLDMMARGGVSHHSSNPFIAADVSPAAKGEQQTTEYSSNWSGAAKTASGFTAVSGEITVPVPQPPPGGSDSKTYYASAWVGIDGFTCSSAILQTGIDVAVEGSSTGYDAWYEWLPNDAYDFDLTINAGDRVRMSVEATSKTTGTATIDNLSTGESRTHTFNNGPASLCEVNAEWIVERFTEISSSGQEKLVPFADYGSFTFTNAQATESGSVVGIDGSDLIIMIENGNDVSECQIESNHELYCQYTG